MRISCKYLLYCLCANLVPLSTRWQVFARDRRADWGSPSSSRWLGSLGLRVLSEGKWEIPEDSVSGNDRFSQGEQSPMLNDFVGKLLISLNAAEQAFMLVELHSEPSLIERFQLNTSGYDDYSAHKCTIESVPNLPKLVNSAPSCGL